MSGISKKHCIFASKEFVYCRIYDIYFKYFALFMAYPQLSSGTIGRIWLTFKKIHIQIISGILLAVFIDYLLLQNSMNITSGIFYIKRYVEKLISDPVNIFYFFNPLIYAISEECVYRGFLLSFFQRIFNNPILSISLSAVLFGVSHYPSFHNIDQVVFASILGFIFGYLRLKEPEKFTLFSLSLAHFLHNAVLQNILYA